MNVKSLVLSCCVLAGLAAAQDSAPPPSKSGAPPVNAPGAMQERVDPALPYAPSLDVKSMDRSADPCADFYQYACGGWMKNNPIPADQTSWSVYGKLYEDNLNYLRAILEQAAVPRPGRDAVTQKVGDYYAACMDEPAVEAAGAKPIQPDLDAIRGLTGVRELAPLVARFQIESVGRGMLFGGGSTQDPDDSSRMIAALDQGGLGLPDRDYYTKEDAKSKEIRARYVQHVERVFELLGTRPRRRRRTPPQ